MIRFAIATLTPAALLAAACLWGDLWTWTALASVTVLVTGLDRWVTALPAARDDATAHLLGRALNVCQALVHLALMPLGVLALAAQPGPVQASALFVALGLYFGQVSNSNAHELIHASRRPLRRLGTLVYISMLFGHHASAHPRVHHVWVATDRDPNSAHKGESFYRFWPRAWAGSFREGWEAETKLRTSGGATPLLHPYTAYLTGAALMLGLAWALADWRGLLVWVAVSVYAQMQLFLSDYIQHYGLRRGAGPNGRFEPAGDRHSWNAPHWFSSAMMLNAPRHSDHHAHPGRSFPALQLDLERMPMLPRPLPVMAAVAMIPPLWRKMMDPRVARWQGGGDLQQSAHDPASADSSLPYRRHPAG